MIDENSFNGGNSYQEMQGFFQKLFNIYPEENRRAMLFGLLGFLWAFGVTSGLKFADALFLLHVGPESLTIAYQYTACIMILMAALMLYTFHVMPIQRIFISALGIGVTFYLFVTYCLQNNLGMEDKWLWFALRIFGTLFFAVIATCFWTFVDHYHHLQDAKRLYGLYSSMIFIGIACTGLNMRLGLFSFQTVVLGVICLLILTGVTILYIGRKLHQVNDEEGLVSAAQIQGSWWQQIKAIASSRITLLLMISCFLMFVLLVLTEYNYMTSFADALDPVGLLKSTGDEQNAQLTQFLGKWIALVNIANIFIGVFLYSRIVRRFGSTSLVICTPLILFVTFAGWPLSSSLIFPLLGLFVVEGSLYVIDDSNFNLLLNAVPTKLKYKIRLMIESFFEPIGMLISAMLLSIEWIDSKTLGLILSICLLFIALALQKDYLKGIYRNLAENVIHFQRRSSDWYRLMPDKECRATEKRLLAIIRQGDEALLPAAIDGLLALNNDTIVPKILRQLDHMGESAKTLCVETLSAQKDLHPHNEVIDHLQLWLENLKSSESLEPAETELRSRLYSAISFYFALIGKLPADAILENLESSNIRLKGAAILALKKSQPTKAEDASFLHTLALQQLNLLLESDKREDVCMGLRILAFDPQPDDARRALPLIQHKDNTIRIAASHALAQTASPQNIDVAKSLITLLTESNDSEFRINCLTALGKIGAHDQAKSIILASIHFRPAERRHAERIIANFGPVISMDMFEMAKDLTCHERGRVLACRILGDLDLDLLRQDVDVIITREIERAYFYFYYYQTIQDAYPEFDLHVLEDALLTGYHSVMDFIIQLLGISGKLEDCELISRSLRSPLPKIRSQVLETLEKMCETKVFRLLSPMVSEMPLREKLHIYTRNHALLNLEQLLDHLEHSSAFVDQIVAAALKYRFNISNWRSSLTRHMSSKEELFNRFASELLET